MEIKILKEQEEGIHMSTIYEGLIATMPFTSVLALPDHGKVFIIRADITGFREDDSTQVHPPDIPTDEEAQVQLMIVLWDRRITMHHRPNTTTDAGLQEHDAPTTWATKKPHEELQIRT
ncbi:hypothetical protein BHE74_00058871 [Ensete ventricosum]|nr:hypothetical protein BHE74_00058871 [Ensete ventricosum]